MAADKIRIKDVAELAGVSVGTVDRVIHNRPNVSKTAREKVEKALKEMDYHPNMSCEQTIEQVADPCTHTCEERRPASAVECTLDTQHPYRSHWGRHKNPYQDSTHHYDRKMYHNNLQSYKIHQ